MTEVDLVIIGAGPAGMSAAAVAAQGDLRVLMLDEQPQPGGQIYRNVAENRRKRGYLGKAYATGANLVDALDHPQIDPVVALAPVDRKAAGTYPI